MVPEISSSSSGLESDNNVHENDHSEATTVPKSWASLPRPLSVTDLAAMPSRESQVRVGYQISTKFQRVQVEKEHLCHLIDYWRGAACTMSRDLSINTAAQSAQSHCSDFLRHRAGPLVWSTRNGNSVVLFALVNDDELPTISLSISEVERSL